MKPRVALMLAMCAGSSAAVQAQEYIQVSYSWQEVFANTTTPVTMPNCVMDVGEGARISITIQAFLNGSNAVGQTTSLQVPPLPGFGTIRGIGSMAYNLRADSLIYGIGTWGPRSISPVLPSGDFTGNSMLGGALLDSFGGGQFVAPGGTVNGTNPIINVFRGVWTPNTYAHQDVIFRAEPGSAVQSGLQNGLLVAYGIEQPDPNDPTTWFDNLSTKYIPTDFGNGVRIRFIPAPSAAAVLGLGALPLLRRPNRRRSVLRP